MTIPQYPLSPGRVAIHDPAIVEAAPTWCTGNDSRTT